MISNMKNKIETVHKLLSIKVNEELLSEGYKLQKLLRDLLTKDFLYWKNKSSIDWLKLGDANKKKINQASVNHRHKSNNIETLFLPDQGWITDLHDIKAAFMHHFKNLYESSIENFSRSNVLSLASLL